MSDYRLEIINTQTKLNNLSENLFSLKVIALDIETVEWWDKYRERISLVQIAYRTAERGIKVAVIDALAPLDLQILRSVLESDRTLKAIHNAAFDAGKLFKHYKFKVSPIFDTMIAARRSGEKRYSLAAQSALHLGLHLDKGAQRSDWSRRPLDVRQLDYAARDAFAALLLYEHQTRRNLFGSFAFKQPGILPAQGTLDLIEPAETERQPAVSQIEKDAIGTDVKANEKTLPETQELPREAQAILSIVSKLPDRYSPAHLAVSVGLGRVGVAGWIVDQTLGKDSDFDEETAKLLIADLCEQKLLRVNEFQKLEMTDQENQEKSRVK